MVSSNHSYFMDGERKRKCPGTPYSTRNDDDDDDDSTQAGYDSKSFFYS